MFPSHIHPFHHGAQTHCLPSMAASWLCFSQGLPCPWFPFPLHILSLVLWDVTQALFPLLSVDICPFYWIMAFSMSSILTSSIWKEYHHRPPSEKTVSPIFPFISCPFLSPHKRQSSFKSCCIQSSRFLPSVLFVALSHWAFAGTSPRQLLLWRSSRSPHAASRAQSSCSFLAAAADMASHSVPRDTLASLARGHRSCWSPTSPTCFSLLSSLPVPHFPDLCYWNSLGLSPPLPLPLMTLSGLMTLSAVPIGNPTSVYSTWIFFLSSKFFCPAA